MEPRSLKYIAEATGGELGPGSPDTLVTRICADSRDVQPGDLFITLAGERFDAHQFLSEVAQRGAVAVVAERAKLPAGFKGCGVIAVDNTRAALGRLGARYRRDFKLPVIAVGGSNGKTSTKELIASVLRQKRAALWSEGSFNNEIGVPMTLLKLDPSHQAAVLEAGTNHPGELAPLLRMMAPHFGVITNIGREHLEFFGDLFGVAREEGAMAEALPDDGALFVNGDSDWTAGIVLRCRSRVVRVGFGEANDWRAENIRVDDRGATFSVQCPRAEFNGDYHIGLLGRHQVANALFALAIGVELGLDRAAIAHGLDSCAAAKMRLQLWQPGGIRVLDDAYNANADSMLAALQTLRDFPCSGRRVAVLGDMAELGASSRAAHAEVGRRVAEFRLDQLFTVGLQAGEIASAARRGGLHGVVEIPEVETAARAVRDFARPGDVVLVKASRAMRLERITEALRGELARKPAN
jgi:UDP-N-acetylmuramoyl-tripeptide--D-alanyl-D-alanine ligase